MRGMEELVAAGKVRFIGVSNFSVRDLVSAQAALSTQRIAANQVRYSLIERTIEGGLLEYCQKNGITVIAYSPLATGLAKIRAVDPERVLRRVAQASAKSEAQVALNWCISKENVIAIPKASTAAHVMENVGLLAGNSSRNWHIYLRKEFAIAAAGLSRWVRGGQSAGACKSLAAGSELIQFLRQR